ncbi:response regulator [Parahaliea sp. F7430]|uniref:histidine kinase n=1 Tax=Sediminihaliea albiluteola TaxID=2758564 RepID=A0A7W2YK46_9GAMM|nr:two-component regulator propeller domain-containing protein [Sediminihaliea albiluteola]MBA6414231.1 response regulator [Sediminihaliea albiluteola]
MRQLGLLVAILLVLVSQNSLALKPRDYTFQISPASRELGQQSVRDIFQDSKGFIWVLTQEGLHRYDGYDVIQFRASNRNPASISHQSTTGIVEDKNGDLWVSTAGGGLNHYDPSSQSFSHIGAIDTISENHPLSNTIYSIFIADNGTIWIGYGVGYGFSSFDPKTKKFTHFPSRSPNSRAVAFAETDEGVIWALVENQGLLKINTKEKSIISVSLPSHSNESDLQRPNHLMADRNGKLWVSSLASGLMKYDPRTEAFKQYRHDPSDRKSLSDSTVYQTYEDFSGNIWAATRGGISVLSPENNEFTRIHTGNSNIPDNQVFSIRQSQSGIIWVGTFNGLAYGTKALFHRVESAAGQLHNSINAFAELQSGEIIIGTSSGLSSYAPKPEGNDFYTDVGPDFIGLSQLDVMSLYSDGNYLWIGTLQSGLEKFDLTSGKREAFRKRITNPNSLSSNGITSVTRLNSEQVLIGTYGGGLNLYDEPSKTFTHYKHSPNDPESISSNNVIALLKDSKGDIWVGTENGLNLFNYKNKTFTQFLSDSNNSKTLSSNMAWALHEDNEGRLWIGTQSGGLNRWDPQSRANRREDFIQYSENIGLPSADIYAVNSDEHGNIWISHNRGLSKLNPQTEEVENYDVSDGLQGAEFNHAAVLKASNGDIYFGGNNGFNIITPATLTRPVYIPPIQITEFKILNNVVFYDTPVNTNKEITLDYNFRYATFKFAALDYTNPELNQYRYMLSGYNNEWVGLGYNRSVSFTSLPSGSYELIVQGSNSDGVWNTDGVRLNLYVKPAPWKSIWAYAIYTTILILVIAYGVTRQRIKSDKALELQRQLEAKVQERTFELEEARLIAEEANRAKSNFFATISHEIRTPMHGVVGMTELLLHSNLSDQQRKFAESIKTSGDSLLGLINSILDFSKVEANKIDVETTTFSLIDLIGDVCYLQAEAASRKNIGLYNIVDPRTPLKVIGDPTKIRQILINLLSNAIKFTHEGYVSIRLETDHDKYSINSIEATIKVIDTGIGVDEQAQSKIFDAFTQADNSTTRKYGGTGLGLAISKQYSQLLGGDLSLISAPDKGTTFVLKLPLDIKKSIDDSNIINSVKIDSVIILLENRLLCEMITSHIESIKNIKIYSTDDIQEFSNLYNEYDLHIVDSGHSQLSTENSLDFFGITPGVLITPITDSSDTKDSTGWRTLNKPVTRASLIKLLSSTASIAKHSPASAPISYDSFPDQKLKVLIAEDVEINQKIAKEMLLLLGCEAFIVSNGQEALNMYRERQFDIIFMDCQMPVMDGFTAAKAIREVELQNRLSRRPIVALTAALTKSDKQRCIDSGMDIHLPKPFTISDLKIVIENTLGPNKTNSLNSNKNKEKDKDQALFTKELNDELSKIEIVNELVLANILEVEKSTGNKLLDSLLHGYRTQMIEKLNELSNSIKMSHYNDAFFSAHAIKSMSTNMGLERVAIISEKIELACKAKDISSINTLTSGLNKSFIEALTELDNLIQRRSSLMDL